MQNQQTMNQQTKICPFSAFSFASSGRDFDPRTRAFSDEELKPQPMIKKSRKQFVPDELKDDKYWARRRKNNIAAKRSRDARRQKENQIAMRARYLEKEVNWLQLLLSHTCLTLSLSFPVTHTLTYVHTNRYIQLIFP